MMPRTKKPQPKKHITYHNDGTRWAVGSTLNGKMNGLWKWFRKDGSIMRSGYFMNNKQAGKWTTYDKNGNVVKVTDLTRKEKSR